MIKQKMFYMRKFKRDIWNLRLITPYLNFRILNNFANNTFLDNFLIKYKKFFIFFFSKYKQNKLRYRRKARPFIYRIDLIEKRIFFKRWKYRFVALRLIKIYYIFLKQKNFRKIARLAKRSSGLFEANFLLLLEGRLLHFLYRSGFVDTLFKSFYIIKGGFVSINSKVITFHNQCVNIFDIVSFSPKIMPYIYCDYLMRLYYFLIMHPPVRCMFASYIFFFFFF